MRQIKPAQLAFGRILIYLLTYLLTGLFRSDGKRPGGLTLIPWQRGLSLTWDVTVVTTLADSYISASASSAGAAAEMAASRKQTKYAALSGSYVFQPIALETLGPVTTIGCAVCDQEVPRTWQMLQTVVYSA